MGCSRGNIILLLCTKQLLDDLTEKRRSWKLKKEALDRTVWRDRIGRMDVSYDRLRDDDDDDVY